MLFSIYLIFSWFKPLLAARAGKQKYFRWIFGSNNDTKKLTISCLFTKRVRGFHLGECIPQQQKSRFDGKDCLRLSVEKQPSPICHGQFNPKVCRYAATLIQTISRSVITQFRVIITHSHTQLPHILFSIKTK